jgi:predicted aconitase
VPTVAVDVEAQLRFQEDFSAMGYFVGRVAKDGIPYFRGVQRASLEDLKTLSAALASSGGVAMFHVEGLTPESGLASKNLETLTFTRKELTETNLQLNDEGAPDFVSVGCPHCSLTELATLAKLLSGRQVTREFWVCCSREVKRQGDQAGYSKIIEESGAKFALDTCMVVAPVEELGYKVVATNSAKACHYMRDAGLKVRFMRLEGCVAEATRG